MTNLAFFADLAPLDAPALRLDFCDNTGDAGGDGAMTSDPSDTASGSLSAFFFLPKQNDY